MSRIKYPVPEPARVVNIPQFAGVLSAFAQKIPRGNTGRNACLLRYGAMSRTPVKADLAGAKRRRVFKEPRL